MRPGNIVRFASLVAVALGLTLSPAAAQTANEQPPEALDLDREEPQSYRKETIEDWQMHCGTPAGAQQEECGLVQHVVAQDIPGVKMSVIAIKTADKKAVLLRVRVPLGVLLPLGLAIYVDGEKLAQVGFIRCIRVGCMAEAKLATEMIEKLTNGKEATFSIHRHRDVGIGVPISLAGFAAGLARLP